MSDFFDRTPEPIRSNPAWVEAAKQHMIACYPEEGCGIFTADGFVAFENVAEDRLTRFKMSPDVFVDHEVLAVVHSHPDGNPFPSAADMTMQIETDVPWAIIVSGKDSAGDPMWFGDQLEPVDLVGRPFMHGIYDCFSLVRDYYRQELGIELADVPRDWDWWNGGLNLYEENMAAWGFRPLDPSTEELRPGDGFLCRLRSEVLNHAGIYIGDGLFLHHAQGSLSHRSPIHVWAKHIDRWVRYEGNTDAA
jgi:cell wall-associated NlpC family hydrolase